MVTHWHVDKQGDRTWLEPSVDKIDKDEPRFTIRAQDKFSWLLVRIWANMVKLAGGPEHKYLDGMIVAQEMEIWQRENPDRVKVPD
ncbi:hypothetical protein LCGC14_1322510 [marine sediment metagenome]|uniref:Uncharacterized protein n=1 Tax=marine sediment metagenome TaxID=412755 RepID=A0A0F9L4I8_9ZZZZ